ncbi:MAG: hypothetical protein Q7U04_01235 [Bacteriovorax sp.]|nr:hypothetical protein [Bacteriovorax sp.]
MKSLLIALCCLILNTAVVLAGPSVTGGLGIEQNFEICENKNLDIHLRLASEITPENYFAFLSEGTEKSTTLKCFESNTAQQVWHCEEQRAGDGQFQIQINRGTDGVKYGVVYRLDIFRKLFELYRLTCDQQVSNK